MLNSKEVLEQTGISRATLNNYISWGIVPKPEVLPPQPQDGAAPRIGYFAEETVTRIAEIQRLKKQGWSMARIAEHFGGTGLGAESRENSDAVTVAAARPVPPEPGALPRLSMDDSHPAYFVNGRFELVWFNDAAARDVFRHAGRPRPASAPHTIFKDLLENPAAHLPGRDELLRFHLALAKRLGVVASSVGADLPPAQARELHDLYETTAALQPGAVAARTLTASAAQPLSIFAVQFREGLLFIHVRGEPAAGHVDEPAAGSELQPVPARKGPSLTHVAVLATDLQHPARIWSELPPEEYFELIDQIWLAVEPIFKRHHATQGKHPGDGLVGYFFPEAGSNYVWNALAAADEVREAMRRISKAWQLRKRWSTELYMNTGIDEGQQWVARPRSPGQLEFTMLGDTLQHACRLSDFARCGAVWVTKNLFAKLTGQEKQRLRFGVPRRSRDGRQVFVQSVFSNIERLSDPATGPSEALKDIGRLPITEVVAVDPDGRRREHSANEHQT